MRSQIILERGGFEAKGVSQTAVGPQRRRPAVGLEVVIYFHTGPQATATANGHGHPHAPRRGPAATAPVPSRIRILSLRISDLGVGGGGE